MHPLHVITPISNPRRFSSRYRLHGLWNRHCERHGVRLYTGEVQQGEREFAVTEDLHGRHLQLRTKHELWHKENIVNLIVQSKLPADWKYVAWVDGDVQFVREDWAEETVHMLQHHPIVQMFTHAVDTGPNGEPLNTFGCFAKEHKAYCAGGKNYWYPHPGFAWACTREAWDTFGGLLDICILGGADYHMAWGLVGLMERAVHEGINCTSQYFEACMAWQERALRLNQDVGFVHGTLVHHFHGKKRDRRYKTRGQLLHDCGFNPNRDIYRDHQGLWQLRPDAIQLRDGIRRYLTERNEDSIDL